MRRGQAGVAAAILAAVFFGWAMGRRSSAPSAPAPGITEPAPEASASEPAPPARPDPSEASRGAAAPPPIAPQLLKSAPTLPITRLGEVTARAGGLTLAREPGPPRTARSDHLLARSIFASPACPQGTLSLELEGELRAPSSAPGPELGKAEAAVYRRAAAQGDYVLLTEGGGPAMVVALVANPVQYSIGPRVFEPLAGRRVQVSGCGGVSERFVVNSIRAVD